MNILFIMYDQLRWDYLSCAGHPHLHTPNFDQVAQMGVRFTNCYVQSPICGASRMSTYTGRYTSSHGATWNGVPLRVGEWTMGDHLRQAGMSCNLIGKTHMTADAIGMERLGLSPDSVIGARQEECGFDIWVRDDGLWAEGPDGFYDQKRSPYNEYLKSQGYPSDNPWQDHANAGIQDGDKATGWFFNNTDLPANIREEDSETPWLTSRAIDFIGQVDDNWCAHVSYIKPHWPYIVPAPYHDMYGQEHVTAAVRSDTELQDTHPVQQAFMDRKVSTAFSEPGVREKVIPAYMGLIKQCDDQLGRLLDHLEATGKMDDTMIVLTSDHGDYLGDHWMGEKDFMHDPSVKVPLIIYDPRPQADQTRGTTCGALVEAIDLTPTFVEAAGGTPQDHILEGLSLIPHLHGTAPKTRDVVISEYDYSMTPMRTQLNLEPKDARLFMAFDGRWKLIHTEGGFRPVLFDLQSDPDELNDLGADPAYAGQRQAMYGHLHTWARRRAQRITFSDSDAAAKSGASLRRGILPFLIDGTEVPDDLTSAYRGPALKDYT
ncbi:MAG: sulfatase-like hydrolase/transferase [Planktomarina sp.]